MKRGEGRRGEESMAATLMDTRPFSPVKHGEESKCEGLLIIPTPIDMGWVHIF
jgi:hypothetical protein